MNIKILLTICWTFVGGAVWAEKEVQLQDQLGKFHIPGAVFQETPLKEVFGALAQSYQKYSDVGGDGKKVLEIRNPEWVEASLNGKIPSQALLYSLYQVAAQAGCELTFEDNAVTFIPLPADEARSASSFPVRDDFIDQLECRAASAVPRNHAFPEELWYLQGDRLTKCFSELGLFITKESRVSYVPSESRILVEATGHELKRVEIFLAGLQQNPRQIRVTTKTISGNVSEVIQEGRFSPIAINQMVLAASRLKGFDALTMPSMVLSTGQTATIDLTQQDGLFDDDWEGQKLKIMAKTRGNGVVGELDFQEKALDKEWKLACDFSLLDGDTLIQKLESEEGSSKYLFTTAELIDATGRRLRPHPSEHGIGPKGIPRNAE